MIIESANIIENPVVSVVVFTYNQEQYIEQCIDAILSQKTDFPYEIIISDDCSKDKTPNICKDYQRRYPERIRLLLQDTNKGVGRNFGDAIALAKGKYVASMAGDDYWTLDTKLQIQKTYLDTHPKCGLCYTNINTCDENNTITQYRWLDIIGRSNSFEEHLLTKGYIAPLTWMYRREMVDRYDLNGSFTDESFGFALDIFAHASVDYIDIISANYREISGTLSHPRTKQRRYEQWLGVFKAQQYYCDKYKVSDEIKFRVCLSGYIELLPLAYACSDVDFIDEASSFLKAVHCDISAYISVCEENVRLEKSLQSVRDSHAYKIGKALLKPLKLFSKR